MTDATKSHTIISNRDKILLGIDSSSTGVAWTIIVKGRPFAWGKIRLDKIKLMPDKLAEMAIGIDSLIEEYKVDILYIEKSIFVKNPATARTLSYIVGGVMTVCAINQLECHDVEPSSWKAFFCYTSLKSTFVKEARDKLGITVGNKLCEELRKSQTYNVIKHNFHDFLIDDHDVADSCGIALYGWHMSVEPLAIEISKDIAIDRAYLAKLGLTL